MTDEEPHLDRSLDELLADAQRVLNPCTVTPTRYGGIYEGGRWAAFRALPDQLPEKAFGGDEDALDWWVGADAAWVGVGGSPDKAFADLVRRWARFGCRACGGIGMVRRAEGAGWKFCDVCQGAGTDNVPKCGYCGNRIDTSMLSDHLRFCPARKETMQDRYREWESRE
jgi:hypothetical protein